MKILVVEDNTSVQELYEGELTLRLGRQTTVLQAFTTDQGLELFRGNPDIDVIIMDGIVPGSMQSTALVRQMRETFKGKIYAASGDARLQGLLLHAGCTRAVNPYTAMDLIVDEFKESGEGRRT